MEQSAGVKRIESCGIHPEDPKVTLIADASPSSRPLPSRRFPSSNLFQDTHHVQQDATPRRTGPVVGCLSYEADKWARWP